MEYNNDKELDSFDEIKSKREFKVQTNTWKKDIEWDPNYLYRTVLYRTLQSINTVDFSMIKKQEGSHFYGSKQLAFFLRGRKGRNNIAL